MCQKAAQEWRIIMGILTRFKDIMSANINALLDKCEDPEKMIDQYMRNLESDLGKVKAETASVMMNAQQMLPSISHMQKRLLRLAMRQMQEHSLRRSSS